MRKPYIKLTAVTIAVIFMFSGIPAAYGTQFFFQARKRGPATGLEVGIRLPFGEGSPPPRKSVIEKLKEEETAGAGTAIAIIVLGACIVAAAVVIANKADDVKEDVLDKVEDIKEDIKDEYSPYVSHSGTVFSRR